MKLNKFIVIDLHTAHIKCIEYLLNKYDEFKKKVR